MARMVNCVKLKKEAEGLDCPPFPGALGARIWREVSKEAWAEWTRNPLQRAERDRGGRDVSVKDLPQTEKED